MNLLPVDELNVLRTKLAPFFEDGRIKADAAEDIPDELLDFFLLTYFVGVQDADEALGTSTDVPPEYVKRAVFHETEGRSFEDRVRLYAAEGGTEYDIMRIAETEMTRLYNTAVLDTASLSAPAGTGKRWMTARDEKVRETHNYLDGMTVPLGAYFWTYDGDYAPAPGLFTLPQNNINCRCVIVLVRSATAAGGG